LRIADDDAAARQKLLEGWAAGQRKKEIAARPPSRARLVVRGLTHRVATGYRRLANRILDRGLDTSAGRREAEHDDPDRLLYLPSDWHVLPRALRYIGMSSQDTFIDFGCGNGRILHQAAKRPFRRVIGVEISPALAEIARRNLAARDREHRCRNVEVVVSDLADYRVPDEVTIGYLYHPVKDETFASLLQSIVDSLDRNPRRVRLIYNLPVQKSDVLASRRFRLLTEQSSWFLGDPASRVAIFEST
jgi:SAM-dependent methyltransferase